MKKLALISLLPSRRLRHSRALVDMEVTMAAEFTPDAVWVCMVEMYQGVGWSNRSTYAFVAFAVPISIGMG